VGRVTGERQARGDHAAASTPQIPAASALEASERRAGARPQAPRVLRLRGVDPQQVELCLRTWFKIGSCCTHVLSVSAQPLAGRWTPTRTPGWWWGAAGMAHINATNAIQYVQWFVGQQVRPGRGVRQKRRAASSPHEPSYMYKLCLDKGRQAEQGGAVYGGACACATDRARACAPRWPTATGPRALSGKKASCCAGSGAFRRSCTPLRPRASSWSATGRRARRWRITCCKSRRQCRPLRHVRMRRGGGCLGTW
jgi:hypothetical protein